MSSRIKILAASSGIALVIILVFLFKTPTEGPIRPLTVGETNDVMKAKGGHTLLSTTTIKDATIYCFVGDTQYGCGYASTNNVVILDYGTGMKPLDDATAPTPIDIMFTSHYVIPDHGFMSIRFRDSALQAQTARINVTLLNSETSMNAAVDGDLAVAVLFPETPIDYYDPLRIRFYDTQDRLIYEEDRRWGEFYLKQ